MKAGHGYGKMNKDWRLRDGELQICTRPGSIMRDSNDAHNLLLRAMPVSATAIQTLLLCEPKAPYEQAGLLWYYDDDNFIKLVIELIDEKQYIVFVREEDAAPTLIGKAPINC